MTLITHHSFGIYCLRSDFSLLFGLTFLPFRVPGKFSAKISFPNSTVRVSFTVRSSWTTIPTHTLESRPQSYWLNFTLASVLPQPTSCSTCVPPLLPHSLSLSAILLLKQITTLPKRFTLHFSKIDQKFFLPFLLHPYQHFEHYSARFTNLAYLFIVAASCLLPKDFKSQRKMLKPCLTSFQMAFWAFL